MAELKAKITADTSGLNAALKKAQAGVAALKPVMVGVAAAGAAAMAGLAVAATGVRQALDLGGKLSDLATQTGMTAGRILVLQEAFKQAGLGADEVAPSVNKLQRAIVEGGQGVATYARAFESIGLRIQDLQALSPAEQFEKVGQAINSVANPTDRAAAAMQIFGRSGGKLLTLFSDGGALTSAANTIGGQAAIMDKNSAVFDRVSDLLSTTSTKLQGVFVGMAESIAPAILPLLERLNQIDLTALGQQLGSAASMFIQAMTDGSIWSIIGDSIKISFGNAANFLFRSLSGVITAIARLIPEIMQNAVTFLGVVTKADFWKGMLQALLGAAQAFGAKLLGIIAQALGLFAKIPGLAGMLEAPLSAVQNAGNSLQGSAEQNLLEGADTLTPFFNQVRERINTSLATASQGFMEGFGGVGDIFELSGVQANLDASFDRLGNTVESLKTKAQTALPSPNADGLISDLGAMGEKSSASNQPLFASSLAKIGGGGGIAGGPTALLDESRRQTNFLRIIASKISAPSNAVPLLA